MALTITEQFAALATALGVGGLLTKGLDLWSKRADAKRHEPADLIRSLSELSGTLSEGGQHLAQGFIEEFKFLRREVADVRDVAAKLRIKVDECQDKHEACEGEVAKLNGRLDASERDRAARGELIAKMLAEHQPAGDYAPTPLGGFVPPKAAT